MSATQAIARLRELRAKIDDARSKAPEPYDHVDGGERRRAYEGYVAGLIIDAYEALPALLECASVLELLVTSIDAAQFEGLHDAIANEDAERMKDLLTRRILHHEHDARLALQALAEGGA